MTDVADTLIVGAGLTGLTAASLLADAGRSVSIIDKGRGVGGRLATRRIGDATLDHGAQFFTVRGDEFRKVVDAAIEAGVVDVWCHGFDEPDGYPRYFCPRGMTTLAKWLTEDLRSHGVQIDTGHRAARVEPFEDGWRLQLEGGGERLGKSLIVTAPVPQTIELLYDGNVVVAQDVAASLRAITYKPTFALLVVLDSPSAMAPPGGDQRSEADLFTFISDNHLKGVSQIPAMTFHVNGEVSAARWDDEPEAIIVDLLAEAKQWIGGATIVESQLHKWKFAGPLQPHPDRHLVVATNPGPLILAGDAFGGPKVEGAFNSGRSAGSALLGKAASSR